MKPAIKMFVTATVLLICSSIYGFGQNAGGDEQQVRAAVEKFTRAFVEADATTLESLLADDYIHVNGSSGSVLNKRQWLEYISSRKAELESGRLKIESYETYDLIARVFKDSAIVTCRIEAKGRRDGSPFFTRWRITHLWIKDGDQWKRAAFHDSVIP